MSDVYKLMEKWMSARSFLIVGKGIERADSFEKAIGRAKYVEDFYERGMLFVKQVLSPLAHGKLLSISDEKARNVKGFVRMFTHKDVPGVNEIGYSLPDQPLLAENKVRYAGEVVALVAADSPEAAIEAANNVEVKIEELPALLDPMEALNRKDILVHEESGTNIAFRTKVRKGDVEKGFSESDVIVENLYRTQHQDHTYLETEAALAIPGLESAITVISGNQYPHLTQKIVSKVLGIPSSKIKVVAPFIGGGFGGKDDEGPLVSAKAALVAHLLGRPALVLYSREESFKVHPKREAAVIRYKTGATSDGKLRAIEVEIIHDTGAYANRGPYILWRATMHASGPYYVPNAKVDGYCVYTNKVYQGSFRGFGNPSVQFAAERQMDELANRLKMDPVELRLKNLLEPGMTTITGQELDSSVGIKEVVSKLAEKAEWSRKREEYSKDNGRLRRGIGIGVAWHGISTSRGVPDWSSGYVKIEKDGSVSAFVGIVEIGQGSPTSSHRQIVAEILGVPLDLVQMYFGTSDAPDTGATHASRGTGVGAIGLYIASIKLRERLNEFAAKLLDSEPDKVIIEDGVVYIKDQPSKRLSWSELISKAYSSGIDLTSTGYFFLPKGKFDDEKGQGFAYISYSYVAMISEVLVDTYTGKVKVLKVWPGLAAGRIINPIQVEGQIEGGAVQGLGYALMEKVEFDASGKIINADFTDYVVPTVRDAPEIEKPVYVEDIFKYGPFGAKGVGEMALIPAPASIANAVAHAIRKKVTSLPLTPENVLSLIEGGER